MLCVTGDLVGTAILPRPLVMVTTRPLAARMRGSTVFTPASTPSTFTSSARLWVSTATHSTSPKVAQPALFTIPHSPELGGWVK